jgi:hypothetical protein
VGEQDPKPRPLLIRFLTCVVRGHQWDPYPPHLRGENKMECARCGLRTSPVNGLWTG